jgi:hypothetical protein
MDDFNNFVKQHKTAVLVIGGLLAAFLLYSYLKNKGSSSASSTSPGSQILYSTGATGPAGPRGPSGGSSFQQAEIVNLQKDLQEGVSNQKTKTPIPFHKVS